MKRKLTALILFFSLSCFSFSGDKLSDLFGGILGGQPNVQNQMWNCPSCGYNNQSDAAYCSKCGRKRSDQFICPYCNALNQPGAFFCSSCGRKINLNQNAVRCPKCNRHFNVNINSVVRICPKCEEGNDPGSSYCRNCGAMLSRYYFFECPECRNEFVSIFPQESEYFYCSQCQKRYSTGYTRCPYCYPGKHKDKRHYHQKHRQSDKPVVMKPILLGSFTKANYEKEVKRYSIGSHTASRNYTKVIVDVHVTQKMPVLINTISVKIGGQVMANPVSTRLHEGRNEFGVSIPQGAAELIISFGHGQGSEVKVSLE
ncbi:MAG: zinc ribbon domain-containing protein [Candidatus Aureabacteria bacterium]|nr:zinc ribbon domain-containing protein [Candidatus Auribacterota bacterium]